MITAPLLFGVLIVGAASLGCSDGEIDLLPRTGQPLTCANGTLDGDETDLDCGGSCEGCAEGKNCEERADCEPGLDCLGTKCRAE